MTNPKLAASKALLEGIIAHLAPTELEQLIDWADNDPQFAEAFIEACAKLNELKTTEWTVCSCGHTAQAHADDGHCIHVYRYNSCKCQKYDGHSYRVKA